MVKLLLGVVVAIYGGAGGYTTGYGRTITKDINSRASTYDIPRINGIWLNGGSGYGFLGKIIMGGSGYGERYKNETHLKRGSFSITPSLGILFFSQKFPLGVMLGITYNTIFSKKWKYDNEKSLSSGPKSPTGGFSVRLTILSGGVGYGKKGNR